MPSQPRLATHLRPLAAALALVVTWLLVHAPLAGAAAGGGSSSFGGGGGGGGFGGGGGSFGGGGTGGSTRIGFGGVLVIGAVIVIFLLFAVIAVIKTIRYNKRRHEHQRRVELAAAEAAGDDEAFAPDAVRAEAERIFREAQLAWDARDDARLAQLLVPELHTEWRRRLDDFARKGWHNRVEVLAINDIRYLGLINREGHKDDRVTVRISARLRDYVVMRGGQILKRRDDDDLTTTLVEYWTLAKRHDAGGGWIIASIESDAEGRHILDREIVATPWGDEQRMGDQSMLEVAALDKLPEGVSTAEVADLDYAGDARTAALDLSLVDGRWAPDVLEVSVRRAVAAWAEAIDGADTDLLGIATPEAARELLHPGDPSERTRLVIRGPRVQQLTISALDPAATPPTMTVEVRVSGRRYIEDRDTAAVLSGSKQVETVVTERWTLALAGPDEQPWQVVDADARGVTA